MELRIPEGGAESSETLREGGEGQKSEFEVAVWPNKVVEGREQEGRAEEPVARQQLHIGWAEGGTEGQREGGRGEGGKEEGEGQREGVTEGGREGGTEGGKEEGE